MNQEQHLVLLDLEERSRRMQHALKVSRLSTSTQNTIPTPGSSRLTPNIAVGAPENNNTIENLEIAAKAAGELAREEEKRMKRQLAEVEKEWQNEKRLKEIEEAKLKEKEQDVRICELKIKEVKR